MTQRWAYFNGSFVPYEQAVVPIGTHALQYGTGCFEGIRAYWNADKKKLAAFKLKDHFDRLSRSAKTLHMSLPQSVDKLCEITVELLQKNNYQENAYIRPLVYKSTDIIGNFNLDKLADGLAIYTVPMGKYLNTNEGVKVKISTWRRMQSEIVPPSAKPTGIYLNTCLAKTEALAAGADEAIMLNLDGSVAEGSAENIFIVKDGQLGTPGLDQNILEGITRNTIIYLAEKELGTKTAQRKIMNEELFLAQEVFLTGTGAEVGAVGEIDGVKIGDGQPGQITSRLQKFYFDIVYGRNEKYRQWLTEI